MNTPVICASLYQSVPSGVNSAGLLVQVRLKEASGVNSAGLLVQVRLKACVATIVSANLSFAMVMAAPKYARVVSRTKPPLELELKLLLLLLLQVRARTRGHEVLRKFLVKVHRLGPPPRVYANVSPLYFCCPADVADSSC